MHILLVVKNDVHCSKEIAGLEKWLSYKSSEAPLASVGNKNKFQKKRIGARN